MAPKIISVNQIKDIVSLIDLMPAIEQGCAAYPSGRAVVPPVGELLLEKGEVHIKYGYIQTGEHYVIKIASGSYDNPTLGLAARCCTSFRIRCTGM
jgi:ornithine cyclodeaminase